MRGCLGGGGCGCAQVDGIPIVTSEERRRELFARIRPPARVCNLEASSCSPFGNVSPLLSPLVRSTACRQQMAQRQSSSSRETAATTTLSGSGRADTRADKSAITPRLSAAAVSGACTASVCGEGGEVDGDDGNFRGGGGALAGVLVGARAGGTGVGCGGRGAGVGSKTRATNGRGGVDAVDSPRKTPLETEDAIAAVRRVAADCAALKPAVVTTAMTVVESLAVVSAISARRTPLPHVAAILAL